MEAFLVLSVIFGFILLKMFIDQRANARREHVRLLEEALKNPALDRGTVESLTYQLTGHRPLRHPGPSRFLSTVLAFGWIALFTGLGLWIIGATTRDDDIAGGGIITGLVGFGLVTYPFALRELEARRQPQ
jgi:hypothetical protein